MGRLSRTVSFAALASIALAACGSDEVDNEATNAIPSGNPNGKDDGASCSKGFDCKSGVCTSGTCSAPTSSDHVRNGDETGLDCGGLHAPTCPGGQPCNVGSDCSSGQCAGGTCTSAPPEPAPTSTDGKKNADESDVDCGGTQTNAPRCATDKGCNVAADCESKVCSPALRCAAPTATDHVQNGDETDVDCGGTTTSAPRCAAGQRCVAHSDCSSDGCDDQNKCALTRSCSHTNGGLTCGSGEVGSPNANHESCCIALPIPGSNTKLDKYKTTAGRMRAFIERVNGNVLDWYETNKASLSQASRNQIEPYKANLPTDKNTYPTGANYQLGGLSILVDRPSTSQGCYVGNANDKAYGAHTYWTDDLMSEDRPFDQAFLDRLPLNCVPYPVAAAFCAWDGGRLQTWEENSAAYGPGLYPWGSAPVAGGFSDVNGIWTQVGPAHVPGQEVGPCPSCNPNQLNWSSNYQFPAGGDPVKDWDFAYFISAPGRFTTDVGVNGHMDLGGLMMELTASPAVAFSPGADRDPKYGDMVRWARAGSWEGHQVNYMKWQSPIMTKYGKTGMRCARD
jgi:hypothetical protein